ncbi:ATP-dependent DNA ligase [Nocardioides sp. Y6]|uniref:DNA ligase (ATP) n=1 Tax=Nocardioides malaquae TaxID=2773426 RepID=A0ABR9RQZ7_9ACTN|nr:ATP-dependent DNA ligase [Nocardioides malaquae]MBE7323995.1 ATP-dependent DNA ligase [Nocardioides malaquae]
MDLPVMPPLAPMLARSAAKVPRDEGWSFEPKWDGFRCLVFRDGDDVELTSRNTKPLTRYFPEVVEAVKRDLPEQVVIDGELFVALTSDDGTQRLDFDALSERIHPADSRVRMLAESTPAGFVAFDLLALGEESYLERPFAERREALEQALGHLDSPVSNPADPGSLGGRCHLTRTTTDPDEATEWFTTFEGAGLDGVVAKPLAAAYAPNQRTMVKVKHTRTADVVLAGYREHKTSTPENPLLGSLLLGLYDETDGEPRLQHVGVAASFTAKRRAELVAELADLVCAPEDHPWGAWSVANPDRIPGAQSRWSAGKDLSFVPLRPERVLEVKYDHMEGRRFRHTAHFVRWRPDREPLSCGYGQLEEPVRYDLARILGTDQRGARP